MPIKIKQDSYLLLLTGYTPSQETAIIDAAMRTNCRSIQRIGKPKTLIIAGSSSICWYIERVEFMAAIEPLIN